MTFTFLIEKEVRRIDRNGKEITKISYILQVIINIFLGIQFNYIQYNQKLKHGK